MSMLIHMSDPAGPDRPNPPKRSLPAVVRTSAPIGAPDPARLADRLSGLVHDLASLLDGSLRQVSLITTSMAHATEHRREQDIIEQRLRTLKAALEQMARSVSIAMQRAGGAGAWSESGSMFDAIHYAAAIMEPMAVEHGVRLNVQCDAGLNRLMPGPSYTIILNGVRNAVEAIASTKRQGGRIDIVATEMNTPGPARVLLQIIDDGPGLPTRRNSRALLEPGVTTKPGHLGVGLSMTLELVEDAGGVMELSDRRDVPGAALRAQIPASLIPCAAARLGGGPDSLTEA